MKKSKSRANSSWTGAGRMALFVLAAVGLAAPSARAAGPQGEVTFTKDIAPILQRSCQRCHRPDSIAPMSLLTYEQVRPFARDIKRRTSLREMPPWFIEKNIGIQQFKNDPSLSEEEVAKVASWVDNGAPQGNPADMPPPLVFGEAAAWTLGKPDLIISSPSVSMEATAPDWWGPIGETPTGLTEDRYVASIEMREVNDLKARTDRKTIGGLFIFHHLTFRMLSPGGDTETDAFQQWPVHEVGRNADVFDSEAARLLKAGSKVFFHSAHMHSNGTRTKGHVDFGFKFQPVGYQPKKPLRSLLTATSDLDIRGMEANQWFEAFSTLAENAKMTLFEPQ